MTSKAVKFPGIFPHVYIDPGIRAGVCAVGPGKRELQWVGLISARAPKNMPGASVSVTFEMPVVYPHGKQKARPKDVVQLAARAGELSTLCKIRGGDIATVVKREPREWKGQVPKAIMCDRIFDLLTQEELDHIEDMILAIPKSYRHNVTDAIGMWLHDVNRL